MIDQTNEKLNVKLSIGIAVQFKCPNLKKKVILPDYQDFERNKPKHG